jgi:hypothetical protein
MKNTKQGKEKEISFTVDLINGLIIYNNFKNTEVVEKKDNIRLIYFRRNRITMTESGDQKSHTITYHLGLQWLNSKKENTQLYRFERSQLDVFGSELLRNGISANSEGNLYFFKP